MSRNMTDFCLLPKGVKACHVSVFHIPWFSLPCSRLGCRLTAATGWASHPPPAVCRERQSVFWDSVYRGPACHIPTCCSDKTRCGTDNETRENPFSTKQRGLATAQRGDGQCHQLRRLGATHAGVYWVFFFSFLFFASAPLHPLLLPGFTQSDVPHGWYVVITKYLKAKRNGKTS